MESKKKRSTGLLIRRFIAGYIFLSVVVQFIGEISKGEFSARSLDDLFFGLLIVFFLAFYSSKKKGKSRTRRRTWAANSKYKLWRYGEYLYIR